MKTLDNEDDAKFETDVNKIDQAPKHESDFEKCKNAFYKLKPQLLHKSKYQKKHVAFVNGKLQDCDDDKAKLVLRMYEKFGNVDMFVDKVETKQSVGSIPSPRLA